MYLSISSPSHGEYLVDLEDRSPEEDFELLVLAARDHSQADRALLSLEGEVPHYEVLAGTHALTPRVPSTAMPVSFGPGIGSLLSIHPEVRVELRLEGVIEGLKEARDDDVAREVLSQLLHVHLTGQLLMIGPPMGKGRSRSKSKSRKRLKLRTGGAKGTKIKAGKSSFKRKGGKSRLKLGKSFKASKKKGGGLKFRFGKKKKKKNKGEKKKEHKQEHEDSGGEPHKEKKKKKNKKEKKPKEHKATEHHGSSGGGGHEKGHPQQEKHESGGGGGGGGGGGSQGGGGAPPPDMQQPLQQDQAPVVSGGNRYAPVPSKPLPPVPSKQQPSPSPPPKPAAHSHAHEPKPAPHERPHEHHAPHREETQRKSPKHVTYSTTNVVNKSKKQNVYNQQQPSPQQQPQYQQPPPYQQQQTASYQQQQPAPYQQPPAPQSYYPSAPLEYDLGTLAALETARLAATPTVVPVPYPVPGQQGPQQQQNTNVNVQIVKKEKPKQQQPDQKPSEQKPSASEPPAEPDLDQEGEPKPLQMAGAPIEPTRTSQLYEKVSKVLLDQAREWYAKHAPARSAWNPAWDQRIKEIVSHRIMELRDDTDIDEVVAKAGVAVIDYVVARILLDRQPPPVRQVGVSRYRRKEHRSDEEYAHLTSVLYHLILRNRRERLSADRLKTALLERYTKEELREHHDLYHQLLLEAAA